jgi:hypothetical protein
MKKMTIHLKLNPIFFNLIKKYVPFEKIESIDVIEILKIDIEQGFKIILCRIDMKEGYTFDDFILPGSSEILCVLQNSGRVFTALMRGQPPMSLVQKFKHISSKFDTDVIWDTPTRMVHDDFIVSVVGEESSLEKIVKYMKLLGSVEKISCTSSFLDQLDMLSFLTDKQRDILIQAKKQGYYEYPRRVNADMLSKHIGISKTTAVEHLRKAEGRIMEHLLSGY